MWLLGLSFVAGVITILAPCVLPLLPIIVGTSVGEDNKKYGKIRPLVIVGSFSVSVLLFTLGVRELAFGIGLKPDILLDIAGVILVIFGVFMVFPQWWTWIATRTGIEQGSGKLLTSKRKKNRWGDVILGFILWPVFNSCSPTYGILIATVLPTSFAVGLANILAYILGLAIMLLAIAYGGRAVVQKMKRAANPDSIFKKLIGMLVIVVGTAIFMGWDKDIEAYLLQNGLWFDTTQWEIEQVQETRKDKEKR